MKKLLAIVLSLSLVIFLIDGAVSLLNDSLILCFGIQALAPVRGLTGLLAIAAALSVYLLVGLTPMIPKRYFLPLALFIPAAMLAAIPLLIYQFERLEQIAWLVSLCQLIFALGLLFWIQGGFRLRWPMVREEQLGKRAFGWLNLSGFVLVNLFVFLPGVVLYLAFCAVLAVDHLSGRFVALRSDRVTMRAQKYVRDDGKMIHLIPMMHIGESSFYRQVAQSFPTNSVILLEGVTDRKNLLKRHLSYKRVATSLGLAEQQEKFEPKQGRPRRADVDVEEFSKGTIEFLNLVTALYAGGLSGEVLLGVMEKSSDSLFAKQLWDDLLAKRNAHLVKEIQSSLLRSDVIVVPWGAAHMRGLAVEIQKSGFRAADTQEYDAVHFRTMWEGLTQRSRRTQRNETAAPALPLPPKP